MVLLPVYFEMYIEKVIQEKNKVRTNEAIQNEI